MRGTPLGDRHELYGAEAVALLGGLKEALRSPIARVAPEIHICLDSLSVARDAGQSPKGSSQGIFKQFRELPTTGYKQKNRMAVQ